jgi:hypothetical protein
LGQLPAVWPRPEFGDREWCDGDPPERLHRGAERVDDCRLDHAAVGDRDEVADRVGEPDADASVEGAEALAAVGRGGRVEHPCTGRGRVFGVEFGEGQARPGVEVALGEAGFDRGLQAERGGGLKAAVGGARDGGDPGGDEGAQCCRGACGPLGERRIASSSWSARSISTGRDDVPRLPAIQRQFIG